MSVHHRSIETRRPYEQIAERIKALIETVRLTGGARLPPERNLASELGVSRASLREALIALEIEGSIEIRSGSGIYLSPSGRLGDISATDLGDSQADLLQARVLLEGAVTSLAAARASESGLHWVEEALVEMHNGIARGSTRVEADRRFHLSIAEQCGNSVFVELVSTLFDSYQSSISSRMGARSETLRGWQCDLDEHEGILRALKSRNPQAAAAEMCHHLQACHRRWGGEPASSCPPWERRSPEGDHGSAKDDQLSAAKPTFFSPLDSTSNLSMPSLGIAEAAQRGSPSTAESSVGLLSAALSS
ncbi:MAG: FadR family transcriptional regulator [Burkholderiales bacterium]|nr:FadR family transcriptional regulator [Burkholderiales bacterium]MBW8891524.1 FadR family transcriptional regulator [Burkholderiales bacterium]